MTRPKSLRTKGVSGESASGDRWECPECRRLIPDRLFKCRRCGYERRKDGK